MVPCDGITHYIPTFSARICVLTAGLRFICVVLLRTTVYLYLHARLLPRCLPLPDVTVTCAVFTYRATLQRCYYTLFTLVVRCVTVTWSFVPTHLPRLLRFGHYSHYPSYCPLHGPATHLPHTNVTLTHVYFTDLRVTHGLDDYVRMMMDHCAPPYVHGLPHCPVAIYSCLHDGLHTLPIACTTVYFTRYLYICTQDDQPLIDGWYCTFAYFGLLM